MKKFGARNSTAGQTKRLGLDLGTKTVKMVELDRSGDAVRLTAFGIKEINAASKDTLPDMVKALAAESRITAKDTAISVSGPAVTVRFLSMPVMDVKELKAAIRFEAEKHIPFNIEECIIDFQVLSKDDREHKMNVLLAAAKREGVENKVKIAEAAGLVVRVVDIDTFALSNAFLKASAPGDTAKTSALIDIGATFTNLSILQGGVISFARDVDIGTSAINAVISKRLGVDIKSSEDLKTLPDDRRQEAIVCAKSALNNLLDDAKLSFSYYENQNGRSIDEICLSGGGVMLFGLEEAFTETFGPKPVIWNPTQSMITDGGTIDAAQLEKTKHLLAVAAGLALR